VAGGDVLVVGGTVGGSDLQCCGVISAVAEFMVRVLMCWWWAALWEDTIFSVVGVVAEFMGQHLGTAVRGGRTQEACNLIC
jgi:hypothetical protein